MGRFDMTYHLTKEENQRRMALYVAGKTDAEMTEILGDSRERYASWRDRRGLGANHNLFAKYRETPEPEIDPRVIDLMDKFGPQHTIESLAIYERRS